MCAAVESDHTAILSSFQTKHLSKSYCLSDISHLLMFQFSHLDKEGPACCVSDLEIDCLHELFGKTGCSEGSEKVQRNEPAMPEAAVRMKLATLTGMKVENTLNAPVCL